MITYFPVCFIDMKINSNLCIFVLDHLYIQRRAKTCKRCLLLIDLIPLFLQSEVKTIVI